MGERGCSSLLAKDQVVGRWLQAELNSELEMRNEELEMAPTHPERRCGAAVSAAFLAWIDRSLAGRGPAPQCSSRSVRCADSTVPILPLRFLRGCQAPNRLDDM